MRYPGKPVASLLADAIDFCTILRPANSDAELERCEVDYPALVIWATRGEGREAIALASALAGRAQGAAQRDIVVTHDSAVMWQALRELATAPTPEPRFMNHYECPRCAEVWSDEWSCQCNDECPECGLGDIEPYASFDLDEVAE